MGTLDSRSKYPPAKPGALCCEPLKAAIGVAGAPPMCGPPEGGSWIPDAPRSGLRRSSEYNFAPDTWERMPHSILLIHLRCFTLCRCRPSMGLCACAWRLTLEVSSIGAWGATAGNVKLLLPPRQSRGISFASLAQDAHLNRTPVIVDMRSLAILLSPTLSSIASSTTPTASSSQARACASVAAE